jgi:hypothetical protein
MSQEPKVQLSREAVLDRGGWHPDFARVLLIEQNRGRALVLVDGNGDGGELEVEYWCHGTEWAEQASSGFGRLDEVCVFESWQPDGFVCAVGRAQPGAETLVGYAGNSYRRVANQYGLWGFVHEADSDSVGELPKLAN